MANLAKLEPRYVCALEIDQHAIGDNPGQLRCSRGSVVIMNYKVRLSWVVIWHHHSVS